MCNGARLDVQVIIAIFGGLSSLLTVILTFRARRQDAERKWFYRQMRGVHELDDADYRRGPANHKEG